MKFLVTGGAGFIGSHLTEYLIQKGNYAIVIDDLSTGSENNLKTVRKSPFFKFVKDSILNEKTVDKMVKEADAVFHLAATVGVRLVLENPLQTLTNNVKGTEIILKYCDKYRKKILVASTSEVYGKNPVNEYSENTDLLLGPTYIKRWSYAASKILDEHLALAYYYSNKLPVVIARLFNIVGERQTGRYGMVIPRFIDQAIHNKFLTIYGDGKQSRSFCYVKDAVWGIYRLMRNKNAVGNIYNIGSEKSITINELAEKIIKITKSKSVKKYISYNEAFGRDFEETKHRKPVIKKIKKSIGFNSPTSLEEIIENIVRSFLNHRNSD